MAGLTDEDNIQAFEVYLPVLFTELFCMDCF